MAVLVLVLVFRSVKIKYLKQDFGNFYLVFARDDEGLLVRTGSCRKKEIAIKPFKLKLLKSAMLHEGG